MTQNAAESLVCNTALISVFQISFLVNFFFWLFIIGSIYTMLGLTINNTTKYEIALIRCSFVLVDRFVSCSSAITFSFVDLC